jgi:azurin
MQIANMKLKMPHQVFLLLIFVSVFQTNAQQPEAQVTLINIEAIPGLQYDKVRFAVRPGEKVKLVLTNKDDMGHNLLITAPESRLEIVNEALQLAEKGPRMDYIPESPQVLWAIPVIYAGESRSVTFNAPKQPGAYPYVCTYPGHGFVMYGVMYVLADGEMPAVTEDPNIPPPRREAALPEHNRDKAHAAHLDQKKQPLHPYEPTPPYLYRVFIENSGLASIAVNLPQNISYCWDATACQLRFAWTGDFLNNTDLWHGHKNAYAKILGNVFYRDKTTYPIRIGSPNTIPEAEYEGYRLIQRYPEFHYLLSGIAVYEIIHPKPDGSGLIRKFSIPEIEEPVWFVFDPDDEVDYEASTGKWENGQLKLSPQQAREFTIIMTKKEEGGHQ